MSKTTFITEGQKGLLKQALELTGSDGFMEDAVAIAACPTGTGAMHGIAVFECFRGGRAEMHLGYAEGRRLSRDMITALAFIAFHPGYFGLKQLLARVPVRNTGAICMLIRAGFEIEYRDRGSVRGGEDGIVLSLSCDDILASAGPSDSDFRSRMTGQQE
ncbi:hypothetical protein [Paracoccus sp. (in: a-proteobacteria)]|uniref:hypothetical protein n=1 Tax=Paracoccus sp. TaxID=267 RepID=UPI003A84AB3D